MFLIFDDFINLTSSSGNADSPLENHLYYTSYGARMDMPIRLTKEEHDHSKISLCIESNLFVSVYSNISTPPKCEIFRFVFLFLLNLTRSHLNSDSRLNKPSPSSHWRLFYRQLQSYLPRLQFLFPKNQNPTPPITVRPSCSHLSTKRATQFTACCINQSMPSRINDIPLFVTFMAAPRSR